MGILDQVLVTDHNHARRTSFGALMMHSHQQGDDAVIDLGHNDQLVLAHVQLGTLTAGDFLFA